MDTVQELHYLDLMFSVNTNPYKNTEIINISGFTIAASNVVEEAGEVTSFLVRKVYVWNGIDPNPSACLFDYNGEMTIGLWYDDTLLLYQHKDNRYIKYIYFLEDRNLNTYRGLVDISEAKGQWQRYYEGVYRY